MKLKGDDFTLLNNNKYKLKSLNQMLNLKNFLIFGVLVVLFGSMKALGVEKVETRDVSAESYVAVTLPGDGEQSTLEAIWSKELSNNDAPNGLEHSLMTYNGNILAVSDLKKSVGPGQQCMLLRLFNLSDGSVKSDTIMRPYPTLMQSVDYVPPYSTFHSACLDDEGNIVVFCKKSYSDPKMLSSATFYMVTFVVDYENLAQSHFDESTLSITILPMSEALSGYNVNSPIKEFKGTLSSGNYEFEYLFPHTAQIRDEVYPQVKFTVCKVTSKRNQVTETQKDFTVYNINNIYDIPYNVDDKDGWYNTNYRYCCDYAPIGNGSYLINMPGEWNYNRFKNRQGEEETRVGRIYFVTPADSVSGEYVATLLPTLSEHTNFNDPRKGISKIVHNGHTLMAYATSYHWPLEGCTFAIECVDSAKTKSQCSTPWGTVPSDKPFKTETAEITDNGVTALRYVCHNANHVTMSDFRQLAAQTPTRDEEGQKVTDMVLYAPGTAMALYRIKTPGGTTGVETSVISRATTEMLLNGKNLTVATENPEILKVFGVNGRCVKMAEVKTEITVDLEDLEGGCYIAKCGDKTMKIILK